MSMMAKRLHLGYTWHGDNATWAKRLDTVSPGDAVVLNPSNGPAYDDMEELQGVKARINQLEKKRALVFGYVHLSQPGTNGFLARSWSAIFNEIKAWRLNYEVQRIFLDELPSDTTATSIRLWLGAVSSLGAPADGDPILIVNPGCPLEKPITKLPRNVVVITFENDYSTFPHRNWAPWEGSIAYNALRGSGLIPDGPRWQAVTSDTLPNPFDEVP